MRRVLNTLILSLGLLVFAATLGGCERQSSDLDEAVEEVRDEAEDLKEEIEDEIDDNT